MTYFSHTTHGNSFLKNLKVTHLSEALRNQTHSWILWQLETWGCEMLSQVTCCCWHCAHWKHWVTVPCEWRKQTGRAAPMSYSMLSLRIQEKGAGSLLQLNLVCQGLMLLEKKQHRKYRKTISFVSNHCVLMYTKMYWESVQMYFI